DHHVPELLPGGKMLLFTVHEGESVFSVAVQSLASGQRRTLIKSGFDAHYLPTGHLVWAEGRSVFAAPFDVERAELTGAYVKLLDQVATVPDSGIGGFSVSRNGTLVFRPQPAPPDRALVWVTRSGVETPLPIERQGLIGPRLSPDGRRLAITMN